MANCPLTPLFHPSALSLHSDHINQLETRLSAPRASFTCCAEIHLQLECSQVAASAAAPASAPAWTLQRGRVVNPPQHVARAFWRRPVLLLLLLPCLLLLHFLLLLFFLLLFIILLLLLLLLDHLFMLPLLLYLLHLSISSSSSCSSFFTSLQLRTQPINF